MIRIALILFLSSFLSLVFSSGDLCCYQDGRFCCLNGASTQTRCAKKCDEYFHSEDGSGRPTCFLKCSSICPECNSYISFSQELFGSCPHDLSLLTPSVKAIATEKALAICKEADKNPSSMKTFSCSVCSPNAYCRQQANSAECGCNKDFSGTGISCRSTRMMAPEAVAFRIDRCATNNGGCSADAVCKDDQAGVPVKCQCNSGFSGDGITCTKEANKSPLYRYWNSVEHFYTTNTNEIGTTTVGTKGNYGYVCEGVVGNIINSPYPGAVPLYRYWNGRDHFYTTNTNEIGTTIPGNQGNHGYTCEGIAGYVFTSSSVSGTVPIYRYWNGVEHFYTQDAGEIGTTTVGRTGKYNYVSEGIAGYIYK